MGAASLHRLQRAGADLHTRDSGPCGSVSERPSTVAAPPASGGPVTPAPAGKNKDTPSPASSGARSLKRQRAEAALHSAHTPRKRLASSARGGRPSMLQLGPDVTVPVCRSVLAFCQPPLYILSGASAAALSLCRCLRYLLHWGHCRSQDTANTRIWVRRCSDWCRHEVRLPQLDWGGVFGDVAAVAEAAPGPAASPAAEATSHSLAAPHTVAAPSVSASVPHAAAGALPAALNWTLGSLLAAGVLAAPTPALPLLQAAAAHAAVVSSADTPAAALAAVAWTASGVPRNMLATSQAAAAQPRGGPLQSPPALCDNRLTAVARAAGGALRSTHAAAQAAAAPGSRRVHSAGPMPGPDGCTRYLLRGGMEALVVDDEKQMPAALGKLRASMHDSHVAIDLVR